MEKWFRYSLMSLGILFILFIEMLFLGMSNVESFDNLFVFIFLAALSLSGISLISGVGLLIQSLGKGISKLFGNKQLKAKRGLSDEEAKLNHIMRRLNDEERSYLEAYLNGQVYEANEDFAYYSDSRYSKKRQKYW